MVCTNLLSIFIFMIVTSTISAGRFLRDAPSGDRSKIAVDYSQKVARITTAIYLQAGLINGTIPPDPLISELLHFGSVTPDQIIKLDTDKVKNSIGSLKGLSEKLEDAKQNEDFMEALIATKKLVDGVPDVLKWTDAEETALSTHLQGIQAMTFTYADQMFKAVERFFMQHNAVRMETMNFSKWELGLQANFEIMDSLLSDFTSLAGTFSTNANQNLKEDAVKGMNDVLSNIFKMADSMTTFDNLKRNKEEEKKTAANFKAIIDATPKLRDGLDPSDVLLSVLTPRGYQSLKYISGFPHGSSDISTLLTDLESKWVKFFIGSDKFPQSVAKLKLIVPVCKTIEKNMVLDDKKTLDSLKTIVTKSRKVVSETSNETISASGDLSNCFKSTSLPLMTNVRALRNDTGTINEVIKTTKEMVASIFTQLTSPDAAKWFKEIGEICAKATSTDKDLLKSTLDEFLKYPHLAKFEKMMKDVDQKLKAIKSHGDVSSDFAKSVNSANQNVQHVKDFVADPEVQSFMKTVNCLNALPDPRPISDLVALSKELRGLKGDPMFAEGTKAVDHVKKIVPDVQKLRKVLVEMKGNSTSATNVLNLIENQQKHATVIGKSSMAISSMKEVLEKKSAVEKVLPHLASLKTLKTGSKLAQKDWTTLDTLATLAAPLQKMFAEIQKWSSSLLSEVKDLDTMKLSDLAGVFSSAQAVSGIAFKKSRSKRSTDLVEMTAALDRLIEENGASSEKKKLEDLREQLQTLQDLGLDYSSFHKEFAEVPASLKALEKFFVSFKEQAEATAAPVEPTNETPTWVYIVIGVLGFLIVLVGAGFGSGWLRERYKRKALEKKFGNKIQKNLAKAFDDRLNAIRETEFPPEHRIKPKLKPKPLVSTSTTPSKDAPNTAVAPPTPEPAPGPVRLMTKNGYMEFMQIMFMRAIGDGGRTEQNVDIDRFRRFCEKIAKEARKVSPKGGTNMLESAETRCSKGLASKGRMRLKEPFEGSTFLHANEIIMPYGRRFILMESPKTNKMLDDPALGPIPGKKSTLEKIWLLAREIGSATIIQLCDKGYEYDPYFPEEIGKKFTGLKGINIELMSKESLCGGVIVERMFNLSHHNDPLIYQFVHYQYIGWPAKFDGNIPPEDVKPIVKLLSILSHDNTPVIAHCDNGGERCGNLAYIQFLFETACNKGGKVKFDVAAVEIAKTRAHALTSWINVAYCIVAIMEYVGNGAAPDLLIEAKAAYLQLRQDYKNNKKAKNPDDCKAIDEDEMEANKPAATATPENNKTVAVDEKTVDKTAADVTKTAEDKSVVKTASNIENLTLGTTGEQ